MGRQIMGPQNRPAATVVDERVPGRTGVPHHLSRARPRTDADQSRALYALEPSPPPFRAVQNPGMEVASIMTPEPITVPGDTALDDAARLMDETGVRHLLVVENEELQGVLSDRDLLGEKGRRHHGAARGALDGHGPRVRDLMHRDVVTVRPKDSVVAASTTIVLRRIGCLPVVEDGALLGIVTEMDLLNAFEKACAEHRLAGDADPPIARVMTADARPVTVGTAIEPAAALMHEMDVRHLPVVDEGRVVGILSDRDLRAARAAAHREGERERDDAPVEAIMTADAITIEPELPLSRAAGLMVEHKISALPVVDEGRLTGIVTLTDVLDHCTTSLRDTENLSG